jgi:hypothetical protein
LTTRVKEPDEDDWGKLKRLLKYIRATIYMPLILILRADSLSIIKWWVDASYAAHGDCRGHTGVTISLGRGSIIGMSKKQKLNTKSSTECELMGVDDASPQMLWTRYFIEGQGYGVEASILKQDYLSTILLEKNGRASSSKRIKHINVRYFFIRDRINSGEITVEHCPVTEMLADHFTKPLQGAMFRKFRAEIQGIPVGMCDADMGWDRPCATDSVDQDAMWSSPQEYVGTHIKHANAAATMSRADVGTNTIVPTISTKDISTVSLCTKAGCVGIQRKPIAEHPRGANEKGIHRSYASVLLGRCR